MPGLRERKFEAVAALVEEMKKSEDMRKKQETSERILFTKLSDVCLPVFNYLGTFVKYILDNNPRQELLVKLSNKLYLRSDGVYLCGKYKTQKDGFIQLEVLDCFSDHNIDKCLDRFISLLKKACGKNKKNIDKREVSISNSRVRLEKYSNVIDIS